MDGEKSGKTKQPGTKDIYRELRRYRSRLAIAGLGVAALSLWNLFEMIMTVLLDREAFIEQMKEITGLSEVFEQFFILFCAAVLTGDLLFRVILCISARREAAGKKCGVGYLLLGVVMLLNSASNLVSYFTGSNLALLDMNSVMSVFLEISAFYTLAELMYSGIRARILAAAVSKSVCSETASGEVYANAG